MIQKHIDTLEAIYGTVINIYLNKTKQKQIDIVNKPAYMSVKY